MAKKKLSIKTIKEFKHNKFFYKYIKLIEKNPYTKNKKKGFQNHHIIPKCFYKLNNIEVDNSYNNLCTLSFKDHILAHYYICKFIRDIHTQLYYKLRYCINIMLNKNELQYEDKDFIKKLKKLIIELPSASPWNTGLTKKDDKRIASMIDKRKETLFKRTGHYGTNNGKKFSKETKQKMSKSMKGKHKNNIWIHKNNKDKHISKKDLKFYLEKGWKRGRSIHIAAWNKGKHWSNNMKKKLSNSAKNRKPMTKKAEKQFKQKCREASLKYHNSKPDIIYCIEDRNYFKSIQKCAKYYKISVYILMKCIAQKISYKGKTFNFTDEKLYKKYIKPEHYNLMKNTYIAMQRNKNKLNDVIEIIKQIPLKRYKVYSLRNIIHKYLPDINIKLIGRALTKIDKSDKFVHFSKLGLTLNSLDELVRKYLKV